VQKQYTSGTLKIVSWAHITNAHIFPGPAIVRALQEAANADFNRYNQSVQTEIFAEPTDEEYQRRDSIGVTSTTTQIRTPTLDDQNLGLDIEKLTVNGKSIEEALQALGPAPASRGLLLLAEMSSENNLLTGSYTEQCVEIAREFPKFVIGFIAQRSLNTKPADNFLVMTPGVSLPAPGASNGKMGDGKGQQYNTPRRQVLEKGSDIVIVGRGIIKAADPVAEAKRYQKEAWEAYEERIKESLVPTSKTRHTGIKTAGNGMGSRSGGDRGWSFGDEGF
jgi:uridine monophosphate synthetase